MAKKGKRRGGKGNLKIVQTAIVAKDVGLLDAYDAFAAGEGLSGAADEIKPPTLGTVVAVGFCKLVRKFTGPMHIMKGVDIL